MYLIYKICKYHKLLRKVFPQYKIDGTRNIWIVKPSYNARGFGIYLVDTVKELVQSGKKGQHKIVQKYIERPYLLKVKREVGGSGNDKSPRPSLGGGVSLRKFDIR
jgi:tubulin monoglycylase TTLL3/8